MGPVTELLSTGLVGALYTCAVLTAADMAAANNTHPAPPPACDCNSINITENDKIVMQVALNLEYLEADYFLWSAFGYGLDSFDPSLAEGGPAPIGVQKANLDPYYQDLFMQTGLQEIGHLMLLKQTLGAEFSFPRPLFNLSKEVFASTMDMAMGMKLNPPFDPYATSLKFLLSAYAIPYSGLTSCVGSSANIVGSSAKLVTAKVLAVEAAQNAIIRDELYRRKDEQVVPYNSTTAEFTTAIANLRNSLAHEFVDEGLVVPEALGADGMIAGNNVVGDGYSSAYSTSAAQFFAVLYRTGNPAIPGGFFPNGASGITAQTLLKNP